MVASTFVFLVAGGTVPCFILTDPFVPKIGFCGCLVEHP